MNPSRLFGLLLLFAACAKEEAVETKPTVPAPVTFVSGSRLRATFHEVDDVKVFIGWTDTQLGKPCAFLEGRCLAGTTRIEQDELSEFEDEACTSRIAMMTSGSAFGGEFDVLVVQSGPHACRTTTLHVRGEPVTPARIFARNAQGVCEEVPRDGDFVRVGPALGPDDATFVRAKEENDTSGGRIVARWRVADDGAREIIGAWDTERDVAVEVSSSGKRWYPKDRASLASESRCPGIATSFVCEPNVVFIGGDGCREPEVYDVGARLPKEACPEAVGGAYEVLSALPTQSFAEAKTVEVGRGRVRLAMSARSDDRPIVPRRLFDTEAKTWCSVQDVDGTSRCLPDSDTRITDAFADAACTQKAILFTPGAGNCDSSPDVPRAAMRTFEHVDVGARIGSAWRSTGAGCEPVVFSGDSSAYLATPLDRSRAPIVTMRTE
jgi:hypothetical protein